MRFSLSGRADFGLSPLTLRRLPSALAPHLSWSYQVSAVFAAVPLPSAHLLNRLALRPVAEFPQPPWMVVTPSTTMASADFCPPERDRSPRIRCDRFPLILAAFTQSCFDPFWTSLSVASSSRTPRLFTQFLSIQSRFCSPASSPRLFAQSQLPSASGSAGHRPQETSTP